MFDLIRDSAFGHLVRLASGNKYFQYPEERDLSVWKKFVHKEKSGNFAHHGHVGPHGDDSDSDDQPVQGLGGVRTRNSVSSDSSKTELPDDSYTYNIASGVRVDPEKGRDIHIVDWFGPDDPDNPKNWSQRKKFFVTFEICLLTFSVYIGSAIYSAGIQGVMKQFGVSQVAATLGLTLFVAGYGLGPLVWAPMSEIPPIGRNPVYIGTLIVFVLFQIPTALASNFCMLLVFRFLTGLFGSPVLATGGASIGDMYKPSKQAYGLAIWGIAAVCGPVLGPLVGGFAAQAEGWTWTIWELMWLSGFCLIFLFFLLPETSSSNILYRRTRRLRKLTGDEKLKCEPEIMAESMTGKDVPLVLIRPITLNFTEPMVFLLNLYIALIYGLLYIWFESFPIVFIQIYHFNLGEEGLAFLGIMCGALVTIPPFFTWLYLYQEKWFNDVGELKPELRLPPAIVGGFFVPVCLFWFGWTARADVHWIVPIIGSSFFSVAAFLLFNSVLSYLSDAYPDYAASVFAGNDFMRSSFGAGFPLFAGAMYRNLGVNWASSTLAFLSIAFIPIPFVLYVYGERLRRMSKHARKDF
ncbi:benomyl/methotrexate resistance protein [Lepidopterella palustris CBS 459.81]|uniref:Benomyl/methotrexate resistance protein n=1 Tax=Lepidopterella palustris CBS 459.81 TaxID=1314670 RepID=A0A8E2ELY3_9PEZI|nr:benomyl/methotrexate resistance protein [Lepidopterella palustris CBS 459.81]